MKNFPLPNCGALFALFFCFVGGHVAASSKPLGQLPFLTEKITVDGKLSEGVWQKALKLELTIETEPSENQPAPVKTEAFLFEDGENLYIAFNALDPSPKNIRSYMSDRDDIWNSELVSVKLDTFNDSRRAFQFYATPEGLQADIILDDNNGTADVSWDAIWFSGGTINKDGYSVEMKIPFNALRFEAGEQVKHWGVELLRVWRRDVVHRISTQAKKRGKDCQICELRTLSGFKNLKSPKNLTVIPSVVASRTESRVPTASALWNDAEVEERGSLDIRWGISEGAFLNATINPDFSQVEADAFQLDANTLSVLSLEEKRPFFQDGKDYFSHWSNLVYTRIFEEPEIGLKYTGKYEAHTLGVMALKDKHTNFLIPYSHGSFFQATEGVESDNLIARYRYDLGEQNYLGATVTQRSARDYENSVLGLDGKIWVGDRDYFRFQSFWSDTQNPDELVALFEGIENGDAPLVAKSMSGNAVALNYTHSGRDWRWYGTYHRFEGGFRADTGFIGVSNWERERYGLFRFWYAQSPDSWWKEFSALVTKIDARELDGKKLSSETNLNFEVKGVYESIFGFDNKFKTEYFNGQAFSRDKVQIWGEFSPVAIVDLAFEFEQSDAIYYAQALAGQTDTIEFEVSAQLFDVLNFEIDLISQQFESAGETLYDFDVINYQLAYQIDERSFIRLSVQQRDFEFLTISGNRDRTEGNQLLYSYKVNPFTLIYLGYSEGAQNDQPQVALVNFEKTLFAKFSYAWQL